MKEKLIKLQDNAIYNITYDCEFWSGCETCDYGSSYIDEFDIEFEDEIIKIKWEQMYEYALGEGYLMKLFLQNIDKIKMLEKEEFIMWLKSKLDSELSIQEEHVNSPEYIIRETKK